MFYLLMRGLLILLVCLGTAGCAAIAATLHDDTYDEGPRQRDKTNKTDANNFSQLLTPAEKREIKKRFPTAFLPALPAKL